MTRTLAVLALLTAAALWGATFALVKATLVYITPEQYLFWRFLVASVILFFIAGWKRELSFSLLVAGGILGVFLHAGYWFQTRGLLDTTPSRSAFLTALAIVLVPVVDRFIHATRVTIPALVGTPIAVTGVFVLLGGIEAEFRYGDFLTVLCAVAFAIHLVLAARFTRRFPATGLAAAQVAVVAAFSTPGLVGLPEGGWNAFVVFSIAFSALFTTAVAFYLMMWGQARLTATQAAILLAFEPVAAAITAIAAGQERAGFSLFAGGALILVAVVLSQIRREPSPHLASESASGIMRDRQRRLQGEARNGAIDSRHQ